VVLVAEAQVEFAHRDPRSFAAPAGLDQLGLEGQHRLERVARLGRKLVFETRDEAQVADLDRYEHAGKKIAPPPAMAAALLDFGATPLESRPFRRGSGRFGRPC